MVNLLDENDNFPVIPKKEYIICRDRQPVCLTAVDADLPEHGAPFSFTLPDRMIPQWKLTQHDGVCCIPKFLASAVINDFERMLVTELCFCFVFGRELCIPGTSREFAIWRLRDPCDGN